jgi:hypothetical protein
MIMASKNLIPVILFSILLLLASCSKEEPPNGPPVADFTVKELVDEIVLTDNSTDPEGDSLRLSWSVSSPGFTLSGTNQREVFFNIPLLDNPTDITVELKVSDLLHETVIQKDITIPVLTDIRLMGLGITEQSKKSNEAGYEWYIDQANTGAHSGVNCGPASVTMAIKWANSLFTGTAEDARNMYRPGGGWWYTSDIINYLNHHEVNNYVVSLGSINKIKEELDNGNVVILCLDMHYIRNESKIKWHIDRFYNAQNPGWGHFIVVKGYRVVDNNLHFEVYDPYGYGKTYTTGQPKGKNRYYRSEDIDYSTGIWWDYAIVVSRTSGKGDDALDPATIPHKWGGR